MSYKETVKLIKRNLELILVIALPGGAVLGNAVQILCS